ncbi:MAG: EamA family transporter [Chloroflexota bacterium]
MHHPEPAARRLAVPAPVLVLAGMFSVQSGAAVARGLIHQVGAVTAVAIRLDIAAVVMLAILRPAVRGRTRRAWLSVGRLALSICLMNGFYYAAIGRLPLGIATTVEFLGPLTLAVVASRRPRDVVAVLVALAGVLAVSGVIGTDVARLDTLGMAFALVAGVGWAGYILASRDAGRQFLQLDGLAFALAAAGVVMTPLALVIGPAGGVGPEQLAAGAVVAVMSSVIPYSLQMVALRSVEPRVFGILLSLEPGVAALVGFVLLGQALVPLELVGIGLVVAASAMVLAAQRVEPAVVLAEAV